MDIHEYNGNLFDFIADSPTPFHAVRWMEEYLCKQGFQRLPEHQEWQLQQGQSYVVNREGEAIIAFTLGSEEPLDGGIRFLAAHTDSPCLRLKPRPDIAAGGYHQLGVEVYGGSLLHPWFDRDLSLAGRICLLDNNSRLCVRLLDFRTPLLTIPSIAIHFDREANKNHNINPQNHLPPIYAVTTDTKDINLESLIVKQLTQSEPELQIAKVLSFDLFCYDVQGPCFTGLDKQFISSARLDNLVSCHAGLMAMATADRTKNNLLYCTNHEENGSLSASGAHGSFIDAVLQRLIGSGEKRMITLANSFLISMDNAHADHPNYRDKSDDKHPIGLNSGPVIKVNGNQRYITNSMGSGVFKQICREAGLLPQEFVMRSDLACGSTIGPMTAARLGVRGIDIGAASLAMHSIRELTGRSDPWMLYQAVLHFLNADTHKYIATR